MKANITKLGADKFPKLRCTVTHRDWLPVLVIGSLYLVLSWLVIHEGFLEYNADGYTRIIHGYEWMLTPRWEVDVWLPLQTWLFGIGLAIHESLTVTPRVMNAVFTFWMLVNVYLIGRTIAGRSAGLMAAAIAVIFPWVVWLGVSGMSEPLFHALLTTGVLGFVRWSVNARERWLGLAAVSLLLASMVRYEAWFYAVVYGFLVIALAWRRRQLRVSTVVLAGLPLLFPLLWMQQHWQYSGDPVQFAHDTSEIKEHLTAENESAGLWRRLTVYPEQAFRLAPRLMALAALATAYAIYRRVWWWPLIALTVGQAVLFVSVSAGFSNLGPGAERYLLSNILLLFTVLAASCLLLPSVRLRLIGLILLAYSVIPLPGILLDPPSEYPDAPTRDVARLAADALDESPSQADSIPVLLPAAPATGFDASYALRILSGHPEDWRFTSDARLFQAWIDTTHPPIWIIDTSSSIAPPLAERIEQVGRFQIGWPMRSAFVSLSSKTIKTGNALEVVGSGYDPGEITQAWFINPADEAVPIDWNVVADAGGVVREKVSIPIKGIAGDWSITIVGATSEVAGGATFQVRADP